MPATPGRDDPSAFFEALSEAYHHAVSTSGGPVERYHRVAGHLLRFRFAGPALLPEVTPALAHHACSSAPDVALTVCLWDSASSGISLPPLPWSHDIVGEAGVVRGFSTERFQTVFQGLAGILTMLDRHRRLALCCVRSADGIPAYEKGSPLRSLFHAWMADHGVSLVHCGAVGLRDGGVLLAGKGGSGKSNTALTCLVSDLLYVGDDHCLVAADPVPTAHSLYSSAKTHAADVERLPSLESMISNPAQLEHEKALYFFHHHVPEKLVPAFPVRAVLLPRVTGRRDTTLDPMSSAAALRALAPSTILLSPHTARETLPVLASLVRRVPAYDLGLGTDPGHTARVILDLLARLRDVRMAS